MPTVETIEQLQELGAIYWSTLNLTEVNYILKFHLDENVNLMAYHAFPDSTIEILLGIEFLKKGGNTENE